MVCFGLSDLRKKKWDYVKIVKEKKKGRVWGFSVFQRREENGGVEEFGGYGIGSTSNGFVTFLFSI